jgi:hypothetical protein
MNDHDHWEEHEHEALVALWCCSAPSRASLLALPRAPDGTRVGQTQAAVDTATVGSPECGLTVSQLIARSHVETAIDTTTKPLLIVTVQPVASLDPRLDLTALFGLFADQVRELVARFITTPREHRNADRQKHDWFPHAPLPCNRGPRLEVGFSTPLERP